ncbi:3-dehydrosphinganine reductase [Geosmithia morbida]|uniref:3-dehydrosphinganine reductase n=1 Tax=Geosmithia morbida TaxID=1094350 RepID=A0A9P4YQZ5_9HYPO|nr:3-dehydrosphinganine reductase [Geosmithia morbida]KAF4121155.1 3-dehydrosphinganine reductase [Geosmithia morbida]
MEGKTVAGIVLASLTILYAVHSMGLFARNKMPVEGKTVLITGASEGMGLAVAKQLSSKGANVVLVSRSVDKLKAALLEVKAAARDSGTQRFHYISADVSAPSYAGPVLTETKRLNGGQPPDIVWCIAGLATPELFNDMDMVSMRRQMDVNYFGTAEMCQAALREWQAPEAPVEATPRHLILTSSAIVFFPVPGYLPYLPSKFAIRGLAEGLSREALLYPQRVEVHLVCPGTILSPGFEREEKIKPEITKQLEASDPRQTPDEVARSSIRGLENGNFFVTVNLFNWLMQVGTLGSANRNGTGILDSIVACLMSFIIWPIVHFALHGDIKKFGKANGHPSTYKKD